MTPDWFRPLSTFLAFNLFGVPILGHLAWDGMLKLNASQGAGIAVLLSLAVAAGILLANVLLTRWAVASGLPKLGELILWTLTGITFVLPIGTGRFSPLNFIANWLG
ncbi:MAG: hypothetical protein AAGF44_02405 [Pseudomonadota bacterium]